LACGIALSILEPTGISAGLHLVSWLPPQLDEAAVVEAAAQAGVGIEGITHRTGSATQAQAA